MNLAYALEQTSDRAGAVATAAVILAWDTPGTDTYVCRLLEEVAYRTAALQLEDEYVPWPTWPPDGQRVVD